VTLVDLLFGGALAALVAALAYLPVRRALSLRLRYGDDERLFIRSREALLERDPGNLTASLELLALYRKHGDHVRVRALHQRTRGHLSGRPEYAPIERAAITGPWLAPDTPSRLGTGRHQSFDHDHHTAIGRLRLEGVGLLDIVEIVELDIEMAGFGTHRSVAVPPELKVLSLEAVATEERLNQYLDHTKSDLPPGLGDLRVRLEDGEITLAGAFMRVPFRMALQVRPASDRALLFHLPRAVQILGIPTIPAGTLADKLVKSIQDRYPTLVTVLSPRSFVVDLAGMSAVPLQLNLSSITVAAGELVLQAREGLAARLDLSPTGLPASGPVLLPPAPAPSAEPASLVAPAVSTSPEEYRRALAAGQLGVALLVGERVLAHRPHDTVLREELVGLAMRTGEAKRAIDLALAPLDQLPPSPRLRLMASQALAGLGRKEEAEVHLEGLESALQGGPGDAQLAQDLVTLATLRVRLLGDLVRGALALERLLVVVGDSPDAEAAEALRPAAQLAWEAGRAELCERLAARLVLCAPLESTGWRLLGLALRRRDRTYRAYAALTHAAWLNPLDRTVHDDAEALRRELDAAFAEPAPPRVLPRSVVHPAEDNGVGHVLRVVLPHLDPLLLTPLENAREPDPVPVREPHAASEQAHPQLFAAARDAAAALELPVPRLYVLPEPDPEVIALEHREPSVQVTTGALAELSRDELAFALGRATWQAGRGDARYRALGRAHQRALAEVLNVVRRPSKWRARFSALGVLPGGEALARSVIGDWAGEVFEETWPREAALARMVPREERDAAAALAMAELTRRPIAADVASWCAALDMSADRAGLHVVRDPRAALSGFVKLELKSRALYAQVKERGLGWGLRTLATPAALRRAVEMMLHAVGEDRVVARNLVV
jgi:hypothetical protein